MLIYGIDKDRTNIIALREAKLTKNRSFVTLDASQTAEGPTFKCARKSTGEGMYVLKYFMFLLNFTSVAETIASAWGAAS